MLQKLVHKGIVDLLNISSNLTWPNITNKQK